MDDKKDENPVRESFSQILWVIAFALFIFLCYHGGELAEIVMDKLR
jgi:hypothetical protein